MQETSHILKILLDVKDALHKKDYIIIKNLSNKIIHQASAGQDPDIISLAVIIYSLSKIIEREDYKKEKNWNTFYKKFINNIEDMIHALKRNDIDRFRFEISSNRKLIESLSGDLKYHINDVFRRAKVNKASRIYEHGVSMEKTAKILGITLWELAEYAGRTRIGDVNLGVTMPLKERIKLAEDIFK